MAIQRVITDREAKAIKPDSKAIPSGIQGLALLPTANAGRGYWRLRYVSPATEKRRDMSLGTYPDLTVARALELAQQARQKIAEGVDPLDERLLKSGTPTFEEMAIQRWENLSPTFKNEKHIKEWIGTLRKHIFPKLGSYRVDRLTTAHFADALKPIWHRIPETAKRVKQRCGDVMDTAKAFGLIDDNPVTLVDHILGQSTPVTRHQPAMPWQVVPQFVASHIANDRFILSTKASLLFLILTAGRSGEIRGATWSEIDFNESTWELPAIRMKARANHRVALSKQAIKLLRLQKGYGLHDTLIFPSPRGKQLSDMAITSLLRRVDAPSDYPDRPATAHGFRSSFRNWAADNGYDRETAERALSHTISNKVQAAYERTDRLEARRNMMQAWADFVLPIEALKNGN